MGWVTFWAILFKNLFGHGLPKYCSSYNSLPSIYSIHSCRNRNANLPNYLTRRESWMISGIKRNCEAMMKFTMEWYVLNCVFVFPNITFFLLTFATLECIHEYENLQKNVAASLFKVHMCKVLCKTLHSDKTRNEIACFRGRNKDHYAKQQWFLLYKCFPIHVLSFFWLNKSNHLLDE
jgi:hypothetical protein